MQDMLVVFLCGWRVFHHIFLMFFLPIMANFFKESLMYFFKKKKEKEKDLNPKDTVRYSFYIYIYNTYIYVLNSKEQ